MKPKLLKICTNMGRILWILWQILMLKWSIPYKKQMFKRFPSLYHVNMLFNIPQHEGPKRLSGHHRFLAKVWAEVNVSSITVWGRPQLFASHFNSVSLGSMYNVSYKYCSNLTPGQLVYCPGSVWQIVCHQTNRQTYLRFLIALPTYPIWRVVITFLAGSGPFPLVTIWKFEIFPAFPVHVHYQAVWHSKSLLWPTDDGLGRNKYDAA